MKLTLSLEDQVLLACLRGQPVPELALDEAHFCHRLNYHRVTALVYQHLVATDTLTRLTPATQTHLKATYQRNIGHNLAISHLLTSITQILQKQGLRVMALKGALLIACFPDYLLRRQMLDLDILVRFEDLYPAYQALQAAGYQTTQPYRFLWQPLYNYTLNAIPLMGTRPEIPPVLVELHWQLFIPVINNTRWSMAELWQQAESSSSGFEQPDPTDVLLHLVAHQCTDLKIYLSGLVDVAQLLSHWADRLDWEEVVHRARRRHILMHLVNILRLTHELLQVPLPACFPTLGQPHLARATPGYNLLLERLFVQEYTENFRQTLRIIQPLRRLEDPAWGWQLWHQYLAPAVADCGHPLKKLLKQRGGAA
ncbi:nucleotidyltransferase family protein [Candidatus Cyanaurora vandensis]|uniref:nucleotidyltransferase domain-containing protein n=1 Tax=Candidatus Cyanaurora vandensis TaxID=2714958 RepID=UPI00257CF03F|nr:nucleotidyltransferase family protein [Candidatus Cyanaurora vandensis]